jgi:hypothetical protein
VFGVKNAWDGKGKSSYVYCYFPLIRFERGFFFICFTTISLSWIISNLSYPYALIHVQYIFFTLVCSLSLPVYIPPLAFPFTDDLNVSVPVSFSRWTSVKLQLLPAGWSSCCLHFSLLSQACPGQAQDQEAFGKTRPWERGLLLVDLKQMDGMGGGFVIDGGGRAAVENRKQNVTTGLLWHVT